MDELEQLLLPDNENCAKQVEIINRIKMNNVYLNQLRNNNSVQLPTEAILENKKNIKKTLNKINTDTKQLKKLKTQRKSSKKRRANRNKLVKQCKEALGDEADWINIKEEAGRPRFVDTAKGKNYVSVLQGLVDAHCAADPRRRSESLVCLQSGAELHRQMEKLGYEVSLSYQYLHLSN